VLVSYLPTETIHPWAAAVCSASVLPLRQPRGLGSAERSPRRRADLTDFFFSLSFPPPRLGGSLLPLLDGAPTGGLVERGDDEGRQKPRKAPTWMQLDSDEALRWTVWEEASVECGFWAGLWGRQIWADGPVWAASQHNVEIASNPSFGRCSSGQPEEAACHVPGIYPAPGHSSQRLQRALASRFRSIFRSFQKWHPDRLPLGDGTLSTDGQQGRVARVEWRVRSFRRFAWAME